MSNFLKKLFGKKNKEEVPNIQNQQNDINKQVTNNENQSIIEPEQPITFNQNLNIGNQTVNPLGFQPTSPTDNIQNNINNQEYNLNPQPIRNQIQPQQQIVPSNEVNNVANQQPITFNQEPLPQQAQPGVLNVIPTLGPTPNPTDPNQNNVNNQNM